MPVLFSSATSPNKTASLSITHLGCLAGEAALHAKKNYLALACMPDIAYACHTVASLRSIVGGG